MDDHLATGNERSAYNDFDSAYGSSTSTDYSWAYIDARSAVTNSSDGANDNTVAMGEGSSHRANSSDENSHCDCRCNTDRYRFRRNY